MVNVYLNHLFVNGYKLGSNECYVLAVSLQESQNLWKQYQIVFSASAYFHAESNTQLEPTLILSKWPYTNC